MSDKLDGLFNCVQERCLWHFHSRAWDRSENIAGVITKATEMLTGKAPVAETPADRTYLADAKILVADFRARFPWLESASEAEIGELMNGLRERLIDLAVTKSRNRELTHALY